MCLYVCVCVHLRTLIKADENLFLSYCPSLLGKKKLFFQPNPVFDRSDSLCFMSDCHIQKGSYKSTLCCLYFYTQISQMTLHCIYGVNSLHQMRFYSEVSDVGFLRSFSEVYFSAPFAKWRGGVAGWVGCGS